MDYFPAIIIIGLIGGIVAVDTAAGWQIMICQPIVSCTFIGMIFGQPEIGITAGILLELPWLINVPSGGSHGSEGNIGAVVAAGLSVYLVSYNINTNNIILITSIVYSLGISRLGTYFVDVARKTNLHLIHRADEAVKQTDFRKIAYLNMSGLIYMFFMGVILAGTGFALGIILLKPLVKFIHPNFDHAFEVAKYGILGLGFGTVATLLINKKTMWYVFAGIAASTLIFLFIHF